MCKHFEHMFTVTLPKLLKYLPNALAYRDPLSESGESPPTLFSILYSLSPWREKNIDFPWKRSFWLFNGLFDEYLQTSFCRRRENGSGVT